MLWHAYKPTRTADKSTHSTRSVTSEISLQKPQRAYPRAKRGDHWMWNHLELVVCDESAQLEDTGPIGIGRGFMMHDR